MYMLLRLPMCLNSWPMLSLQMCLYIAPSVETLPTWRHKDLGGSTIIIYFSVSLPPSWQYLRRLGTMGVLWFVNGLCGLGDALLLHLLLLTQQVMLQASRLFEHIMLQSSWPFEQSFCFFLVSILLLLSCVP